MKYLVVVAGAEFHVLVVRGHGITGVAMVTVKLDHIAAFLVIDKERVVLGPPVLTVNVPQIDAQHRRLVLS